MKNKFKCFLFKITLQVKLFGSVVLSAYVPLGHIATHDMKSAKFK